MVSEFQGGYTSLSIAEFCGAVSGVVKFERVSRIALAAESKAGSLRDSESNGGRPDRAGAKAAVDKLYGSGELSLDMMFDTRDNAAKYFADKLYDISKQYNIELGAELVKNIKQWSIGEVQYGRMDSRGHYIELSGKYVIHTHPSGSSFPSDMDRLLVRNPAELFRKHAGIYTVGSRRDITYCGASCSDGGCPRTVR